jgi:hypothetical protein
MTACSQRFTQRESTQASPMPMSQRVSSTQAVPSELHC